MPGYPQELPRQEERLYFRGIGWCSVLFDLHKPIASRADFSQAASMKGLFPRLQHRSLQSMNDLFSLLDQTQCCHFLDPKKHPNMEKRGYQSMFFILIEMINLLFLQKHSIQSDEMCSLSIDPFYRLSYCKHVYLPGTILPRTSWTHSERHQCNKVRMDLEFHLIICFWSINS